MFHLRYSEEEAADPPSEEKVTGRRATDIDALERWLLKEAMDESEVLIDTRYLLLLIQERREWERRSYEVLELAEANRESAQKALDALRTDSRRVI